MSSTCSHSAQENRRNKAVTVAQRETLNTFNVSKGPLSLPPAVPWPPHGRMGKARAGDPQEEAGKASPGLVQECAPFNIRQEVILLDPRDPQRHLILLEKTAARGCGLYKAQSRVAPVRALSTHEVHF